MADDKNYNYYRTSLTLENFDDREGIYLIDSELQELINGANLDLHYQHNVGIRHERIKHNVREKAFFVNWLKENIPSPGVNGGRGLLSCLFADYDKVSFSEITLRERMIVATVIQWLGSNIGFGFIETTLKDCGYNVISTKDYEALKNELNSLKELKELAKKIK